MKPIIEKTEISIYEDQYQDQISMIQRWPEWKIQSFCLDQTDLRLLQTIRINMSELQGKSHA